MLFCYFASCPQTKIWKEVLFLFSCPYFKIKAGRLWGTPTFPLRRHTQRSLCGFTPIRNLPDISRWIQMSFLFRAVFAMPCDLRKKAALIFFPQRYSLVFDVLIWFCNPFSFFILSRHKFELDLKLSCYYSKRQKN